MWKIVISVVPHLKIPIAPSFFFIPFDISTVEWIFIRNPSAEPWSTFLHKMYSWHPGIHHVKQLRQMATFGRYLMDYCVYPNSNKFHEMLIDGSHSSLMRFDVSIFWKLVIIMKCQVAYNLVHLDATQSGNEPIHISLTEVHSSRSPLLLLLFILNLLYIWYIKFIFIIHKTL